MYMKCYKGNKQLTKLLKTNYSLDESEKWNKFVQRRGYNTLKYGYLEPLKIKNKKIKYEEFRNITSYCSEVSIILFKYILISERRLINSMLTIFGDKSTKWHDPLVYDFGVRSNKNKNKDIDIKKFISKTQNLIKYNDVRFSNELTKYKYINLWTISEKFTFGNIKTFWNITDTKFKQEWDVKFGLSKKNKYNKLIQTEFKNSIYSKTKLRKDYQNLHTIGLINKNLNLLNKCRNVFAHNESILNREVRLVDLIAALTIFLQAKEINKMSKEIIALNKKYLVENPLFLSMSIEQKNMFSVNSLELKSLNKHKLATKW